MSDLPGKTALVTGASRGIGRASAVALAKAGARVIIHYSRGAAEAEAALAEIRNGGGSADMVAADLAAPDGAHVLARRVRDLSDRLRYTLGLQALQRIAESDDIASVVAFLASGAARWINGDTIHVDGGSKP